MDDRSLNLGTIFRAETEKFFEGTRKIRGELKRFAAEAGKVRADVSRLDKSITGVSSASIQGAGATKRLAMAHAVLGKQISGVSGGLERIKAAMKVTASYGVAATLIFGFTRALRAGGDEIIQFDQGLKNLQAITGATNAQIATMSVTMLELARDTKFSSSEIAEGMVLLGQAGFSAEESLDAIKATAALATGTLTEMKTTADLVTTTIRAFNLQTIESSRVADVFANAVNKSKLTIDKLRIAFNFIGAAASQAGLSLEETAAATALLANNGLRASTIGTGLRQVIAKLIAPNEKLRESFQAHGIDLAKVNAEGFNFQKTLRHLAPLLIDHRTKTVNMAKAYELFKLRGAQAAAVLIKGFTSGAFDDLLTKIREVGTASEMSAIQQEGLAVKFKNLADRAGTLALAFGDVGVAGAMRAFIDVTKDAITATEEFVRSGLGTMAIQAAGLTAIIYGLSKAFAALKGPLASLVGLYIAFTNRMAMTGIVNAAIQTFGKFNLVMIGLSALIAGLVVVMNRFNGRIERSAKEHSKLSIEAQKNVKVLDLYKKSLEDLHKKGSKDSVEQYRATIKRLAEDYSDLGSETDLLAEKHDVLIDKIKKASAEQFKMSLDDAIVSARQYAKEISRLKNLFVRPGAGEDFDLDDFLNPESYKKWREQREEEFQKIPQVNEALKRNAEAREAIIDIMLEGVYSGKLTIDQAKEMVVQLEKENLLLDSATVTVDKLTKALKKLKETKIEDSFGQVERMSNEFLLIYKTLSKYEKITFLKDIKKLNSELASVKKVMGDFGLSEKEVQEVTDALTKSFLDLSKSTRLTGRFKMLYDKLSDFKKGDFLSAFKALNSEIGNVTKTMREFGIAEEEIEKKTNQLKQQFLELQSAAQAAGGMDAVEWSRFLQAKALKRDAEDLHGRFKALTQMSTEVRNIYKNLSDVQKVSFLNDFLSLQNSIIDTVEQMEKMNFSAEQIQKVVRQMINDFATLRGNDAWGGIRQGLRDYTEEVRYSASNWYDFAKNSMEGMQGVFKSFLVDMGKGADFMDNLWKNLGDSMLNNWADVISKMIMKFTTSSLPRLFEMFGGVFGGSKLGPVASYGIAGREGGGPVFAGVPYIVGEKRPEVFVPDRNGTIHPNAAEFGKTEVYIQNNTGQNATVRRSQGPNNSEQFFVSIGSDIKNGGKTAQALEQVYGLRRKGR